jgi:hypothetical protein
MRVPRAIEAARQRWSISSRMNTTGLYRTGRLATRYEYRHRRSRQERPKQVVTLEVYDLLPWNGLQVPSPRICNTTSPLS